MAINRIRSIAFPFKKGALAFPQEANDSDAIKASVIQIVITNKGERRMRPAYGCDAFSFVFENLNEDLRIRVEREVRQSISRWESRARVDSVSVTSGDITEPGQIVITINYTILLDGRQDSVSIAGGL